MNASGPISSLPTGWELTGTLRRVRRLAPFTGLTVLAFAGAWMLPDTHRHTSFIFAGGLVMAISGLAIVALPWQRLPLELRHVPGLTFCVGVVFLRHGAGGAEAAYGSVLLLLPVIWNAVYGRKIDLAIALAYLPLALLLPVALLEEYPANVEVPRSLLLLVLAIGIAATLRGLLATIDSNDAALHQLVTSSADLHAVDDPRPAVVDAVRQLVAADDAALFEEVDGALHLTAATDPARWSDDDVVHAEQLDPGRFAFIGSDHERRLQLRLGPGDGTTRVVVARWHDAGRPPRQPVLRSLVILGSHAGLAIERAELVTALDRKANLDGLTGLPNRRAWDAALGRAIARADAEDTPLSMAILDLDHFKAFNDTQGHLAGDQLLCDITEAWTHALHGDLIARWGGEEFAVLFENADLEQAEQVISRLRAATPGPVTFSAGLSDHRRGESASTLMATADAAMYQAKDLGRDRVVRAGRPEDTGWSRP